MNYSKIRFFLALLISGSLTACSSNSSDDGDNSTDTLTGVFIDSAVQGLEFETTSQSGTTNAAGEFRYQEGETVTFSIGSMAFPSATGAALLTPIELASGSSDSEATATNIARLVQSLDEDGDPSNGIVIPDGASDIAVPVNFDVSITEFENNPDVINLVANSGSVIGVLISAEQATAHLLASLSPDPVDGLDPTGFWESAGDYVLIEANGDNTYTVTFYDIQSAESCFTIREGTLELLMDNLFLLSSGGEQVQVVIAREPNTLSVVPLGSFELETTLTPGELTLCV